MITSDYHIIAPETASINWTDCRLLLELNRHFFHYIIISGENTITALKYYRLTPSPEKGLIELLEGIIADDDLLQKAIPVSTIIYNLPENHLVPEVFFNESIKEDFIALVHGDFCKEIILSEKIDNTAIYNVYLVPGKLHEFLKRTFKPAQFKHSYSLLIDWKQKHLAALQQAVHAIFYPNELQVIVINRGAVELVQTFNYETTEDAVYHLLNIYKQYYFSANELALNVSGMVATDSAMYDELLKYFMQVEIVLPSQQLDLAPDFRQFPAHFFSPILNLSLCV